MLNHSNVKFASLYLFYKDNPRRNPSPGLIPRRVSSQPPYSIQLDSLPPPPYDIVKDVDPNLPSYESIV